MGPASIQIPTKVYRHPQHPEENYFSSKGEESDAIYPLQNGRIVDLPAFLYLIKLVYKSAAKKAQSISNPALLLVVSGNYTRLQTEEITRYVFESIGAPGFYVLSNALAAAFAYASQDALVIDIGKDKTEITPVLDFSPVSAAQSILTIGGNNINENLQKLLPDLSQSQIETLKLSPIYEILTADEHKNSWFALNPSNEPDKDEGIVDVAAIVTSGRTREILEEREKEKQGEPKKEEPPNMDREFNTFVDDDGKVIEVGKQRFYGSEELIDRICTAVGQSTKKIDMVNKRQDLWDNIIIIGNGSRVKGLKEALLTSLQERFLVSRASSYPDSSGFNSSYNSPTPSALYTASNQGHGQSPSSMKVLKMSEYFPEWKGVGWEDASFLGAEIAAKQVFGGSADNACVTRREYNEIGPSSIWDI